MVGGQGAQRWASAREGVFSGGPGGLKTLGCNVVFVCNGAAGHSSSGLRAVCGSFCSITGKYHITLCRDSGNALAHLPWPLCFC